MNQQLEFLGLKPNGGTRWFRRKARVTLAEGALVATNRWGRTASYPLDGSHRAPASYRAVLQYPKDDTFVFVDGSGEAVVIIEQPTLWPIEGSHRFAERLGLKFDGTQKTPPLRRDGIRLRDSRWVEMPYISSALVLSIVIYTLGKLEVLSLFPWGVVAVGLDGFAVAGLASGRYQPFVPEDREHPHGRRQEEAVRDKRARQKRRKRRSRQRR